jgi:hypothetical protein
MSARGGQLQALPACHPKNAAAVGTEPNTVRVANLMSCCEGETGLGIWVQ